MPIANSKLLYNLGKSSLFVYMLSTFFLVVWERDKYLFSTHFYRTDCNAMWGGGWGYQVLTAGSKDPNNQCVHIYSTHFAWTSCTTRGLGCQVCTAGSKDPIQLSVHTTIHVLHFVFLVHTLCLAQFHFFVLLYIYTWVPYLYNCTLSALILFRCLCTLLHKNLVPFHSEW